MKKIDRRDFLKRAGLGALALGAAGSLPLDAFAAAKRRQGKKPNILVFVADDAGWQDFGCYGNPYIKTPNIDKLAKEGLKVERAFLTCAQCSPSRTSMLTGQFPHTIGTEDLHTPLPEGTRTVMSYLSDAGYFTGNYMKSHIGEYGDAQWDWQEEDVWDHYGDGTWVDKEMDSFKDFLSKAGEDPFFLWVGYIDPHRGYGEDEGDNAAPELHSADEVVVYPNLANEPGTRKELAQYYDEIARVDGQIGKYLAYLDEHGMREDTVIMFISDNGMPFPRAKGTCYDAGIQTPMVVNWPGVIEPGSVYKKDMVSTIDLAPTLLDIAGAPVPETMYGKSFKKIFTDQDAEGREYVFAERNWHDADEHMRSIRSDKYKLILNSYIEWPFGVPKDISTGDAYYDLKRLQREGKLTPEQARTFECPRARVELYDLENDPGEFVNLADDPAHVPEGKKLYEKLAEWMEETNDYPSHLKRRHDNVDRVTGFPMTDWGTDVYWYEDK